MFDVDLIIPCYGKAEIIEKGIASLAIQWKKEFLHVTLVNDCSPNTNDNYQYLVDKYSNFLDIRCIKTPENAGQGLARQYGIDHTKHDYFMFMDEDDQLGNGVSFSVFVGAVETANFAKDETGNFLLNEKGEFKTVNNSKPIAIVSAPLFAFDNNFSNVINNDNRVWVNSKLYNRKFIETHNIKFNKAQSRHAEDYYWMSCFFYALDNDKEYQGILLDNDSIYYLWYPNENSQSRCDPHYGYMLAGYTMNGSVNILNYIKNPEKNKIEWNEETKQQYKYMLLNMTMYSYFTFQAFIKHVKETDYIPTNEDWIILKDSCNELRTMLKEYPFQEFLYTEWIEQYYLVKNNSDVQFVEPWYEFPHYVENGCEEFLWNHEKLLSIKEIKNGLSGV